MYNKKTKKKKKNKKKNDLLLITLCHENKYLIEVSSSTGK